MHTPFLAHYAGLWQGRELRVPVVETRHTHFEEYFHHYLPFLPAGLLRRAARRLTVRQCDAVDALVVPLRAMLEVPRRYDVALVRAVARREARGAVRTSRRRPRGSTHRLGA